VVSSDVKSVQRDCHGIYFYFHVCVRGVPFRQSVGDGNEVNGEPEIVDDVFDEPPPAAARGISFESPRRE
jgi:hypothetical protein